MPVVLFGRFPPSSTFNHSDGAELDGLLTDACVMTRVDHICDVLVGLWCLMVNKTC